LIGIPLGPFLLNLMRPHRRATAAPRQDSQLVQYAQEEHHELKEKTESKVDELKGDAAAVPNAVEAEHEEHAANEANDTGAEEHH